MLTREATTYWRHHRGRTLVWFVSICLLLPVVGIAQNTIESVQSFLCDRGLVRYHRSWVPLENPALLSRQDGMRLHVELHRISNQFLSLNFASPLSSQSGLGLAWFSQTQNRMVSEGNDILNQTWKDQTFFFNLGLRHPFIWGHQLEVLNSQRVAYPLGLNPKPRTSQVIAVSYRVGVYQPISKSLRLGLVSPPLVYFQYHVFPEGGQEPEMQVHWLHEPATETWLPLVALEWQWTDKIETFVSNRAKTGTSDWQVSQVYQNSLFSVYGTVRYQESEKRLDFIGGMGAHIKGMDVVAGYDVSDRAFRVGLGFSPEQQRDLIDLVKVRTIKTNLYPYHQFSRIQESLAELTVQNQIAQSVQVNLQLSGEGLPSVMRHYELGPLEVRTLQIPVPDQVYEKGPGSYLYSLTLTAFQRGRHMIHDQISFTVCDRHAWSGLYSDLIYFVRPFDAKVLALSRQISQQCRVSGQGPLHIATVQGFYEYIQRAIDYLSDPEGWPEIGDHIQYPDETLKLKSGDCEDLSILMISLLKSVGIDAAFAEYIRPESKQGHVFILMDSGLSAADVVSQQGNLQRYILRYDASGNPRLYVPLELTEAQLSFEASWAFGMEMYQQLAIEQGGLVEGWFHIIDVP